MPAALPVSRLIKVSVQLTPAGAQAQNLSTMLVLGSSNIIDSFERYRDYATMDAVALDFSANMPEYLSALLWFQQSPQPTNLRIGRWFATAGNGVLRGAPLSAAQQLLSNFTSVTSGGFVYARNGGSNNTVTGVNLSAAADLNAVAAAITASTTGVTVVWNANYSRFEVTSTTTGATSSVSFFTAPGAGTDLSSLLGLQAASSGSYRADGVAAESALAAVQFFDQTYGQAWYSVMIPQAVNADHLQVAAFIEAANNKHVYGVTTLEGAALVAAATSDIAYQLAQFRYKRTTVQYSSSSPYAVASYLSKASSVDYTANNTVITLMYKGEPGIVAESLNSSQADALKAKNCNAFVNYNNNTAIVQNGVQSSGDFTDIVTGTDWMAVTLQTNAYNLLYTSTTKIPQTDAGTNLLVVTCEAVMSQAVINGLCAPGVWNSGGFGTLKQGDYLDKGFYVYAPPVSSQNPADRAARKSVPIQIAAKLAGAIHEVSIAVTVNQ